MKQTNKQTPWDISHYNYKTHTGLIVFVCYTDISQFSEGFGATRGNYGNERVKKKGGGEAETLKDDCIKKCSSFF